MRCSKCKREAILYQPYSGQHLCREHLVHDIETKAKRTIRYQKGIQPGDHIAVILNGNAADNALLFFLQKLTAKRRDIRVSAIPAGTTRDNTVVAGNARVVRIASATTLEDASVTILMDILHGNPGICFSGDKPAGSALRIVTPFVHIPSDEIALYARINGLEDTKAVCHEDNNLLYADVKRLLGEYTGRHPAAPHAILNLCNMLRADAEQIRK